MSSRLKTSLSLKNLIIPIHIGWSELEREKAQDITVNILIEFAVPPLACETDELEDTICYKTLSDKIRQYCTSREFKLIEYLGYQLYQFIKEQLSLKTDITISIVKPRSPFLTESRTFNISDAKEE